MAVRFFPTPKKIGPFDATKAAAPRPPLASTSANGKTVTREWKRSKANLRKNPRPAEKKAAKERIDKLRERFNRKPKADAAPKSEGEK